MVISKVALTFGISLMFIIFVIFLFQITFNVNENTSVNAKNSDSSSKDAHISSTPHKENQSHNKSHHEPSFQLPIETSSNFKTQLSKSKTTTTAASENNQEIVPTIPSDFNKVVILTFGDGYQSQYTIAKPILDKYGYKGNFFVTCNKVGTANKMTWPELVQLYEEGNVIGSKTMNYGTKAMEGKDLNHLSQSQLEFEVGQSKQCLLNHGINTTFFAVPMNIANDNVTVINEIAKYYTLAINGHADQMYLHCDGYKKNSSQTDCRTYFDNGTLTFANRYSIGEWSEQHIKNGYSFNDSQMFAKFIAVVNSQDKFNRNGVSAIPLIAYHDIVLLPDITLSKEPSATTLNLFNAEMKYLHDNGFNVLTFYNLGYDNKKNIFILKYNGE
jgi:hypothetical protein